MSKKYDNNLNEIKDNVPTKTFSITSSGANVENLAQPVNIDTYEEENKQLKQQLAERDKEILDWKDGTMICNYEKMLAEKYKEIERLKMAFKDMRCLKNRAIKSLKDTVNELREGLADQRHQICEEIRGHLLNLCDWKEDKLQGYWYATEKKINYVIDQVEKNEVGEINE